MTALRQRGRRWVKSCIALGILAALVLAANRQARTYHDPGTLWRDVLEKNPDAWMAHNNLGVWLQSSGDLTGAAAAFEASIAIRPDNDAAHINLATIAEARHQNAEAVRRYQRGLALAPNSAELHAALANRYAYDGDVEQGIAHYRRALEL